MKRGPLPSCLTPLSPVLTALFAVLNPISFQLSCAHPLRGPPLQRDGGVADVINAQSNGLASRSWGKTEHS